MFYTFLSSVFITLFMVVGFCAFQQYFEVADKNLPLSWAFYQHVIVLAIVAIVCLILATFFGYQIPECYVY